MGMLAGPATSLAQGGDSIVVRVQRLVSSGNRAGARALADSAVAARPEGTPAHGEALFARAFASSSAAEAERDYLRVSVEYSLSARAEEATMMVAQLKLARSDRIGARRNFERLVREHPNGVLTAKAAFWAGRLAVEDGDLVRGCASLGRARERAPRDDVELANQIEYYAQRCTASALARSLPPDSVPEAAPAPAPPAPVPATPPPARTPPPRRDSVVPPRAPATDTARAGPGKTYSLQVAAFNKQRDAVALSDVLKQRGFPVRVWGTKAPFRVRVGRYPTREDAEAALVRMKAARVNGIVVEAEPQ